MASSALRTVGIDGVTIHGLRHADVSWLLAGGADIQVVKERMGHAKISTTEGYLHTLPDVDDTALTALSKIRGGGTGDTALEGAQREIDTLKAALMDLTIRLHQSGSADTSARASARIS